MTFTPVIGFEIHLQPKTAHKMFCGCAVPLPESAPNTLICPTCFGLPGALPQLNREAIEKAAVLAQVCGSTISPQLRFDRKHYFYPDLAKGFQISQYHQPFATGGLFPFPGGAVRIRQIQIEEDTAKINRERERTLLDFNRSGVPLLELITEPDFTDLDHAIHFLKDLHVTLTSVGISDAQMEWGTLRVEPNISLRPEGDTELPPYKVELKNINSFSYARRALLFEIDRQSELLARGERVVQETRGWDEGTKATVSQRTKEELHDYRYLPEPDIPVIDLSEFIQQHSNDSVRERLPERRRTTLRERYGLTQEQAEELVANETIHVLFEQVVAAGILPQRAANVLRNTPRVGERTVQEVLVVCGERVPDRTLDLTEFIQRAIKDHPHVAADYRAGKEAALHRLVGEVMRATEGRADAEEVMRRFKEALA